MRAAYGHTLMTRAHMLATTVALMAFSGCAVGRDREVDAPAADWRRVASSADRERLRSWRTAWTTALKAARASGAGERIDAGGTLFSPDAALDRPLPPPGNYSCRAYRLGAASPGGRNFIADPAATCRIEDDSGRLKFAKLDGPQRPSGRLYADAGAMGRVIFLGSLRLADERRSLGYGADPERDMVGILERIGADRWRLALPQPRWEAMLTVIELTPAR